MTQVIFRGIYAILTNQATHSLCAIVPKENAKKIPW